MRGAGNCQEKLSPNNGLRDHRVTHRLACQFIELPDRHLNLFLPIACVARRAEAAPYETRGSWFVACCVFDPRTITYRIWDGRIKVAHDTT